MLKKRISNPVVRGLVEWAIAIGLAFLLFFVLRMYVFRVAHVSGESMHPTLHDGDRVILNRAAIVFGEPQVGDIVAYPYPGNPSEYHIKRVIGVYGDVVDFVNGGFIVNGTPLEDDFSHEVVWSMGNVYFPLTVEEGRVFVLGDNRNASKDSRYSTVGTVANDDIIGRVLVRIWPFDSLGQVE
ncbi:MAG: signal peptidase I [Defluviitaleaceae bacterium]|nr:signal peptidase I [Defluviitaleaceae bacterium]